MDTIANRLVELTPEAEPLFDLMLQIPPDLPRLREALREGRFSGDDINRLAIDFVYECSGDEPPEDHRRAHGRGGRQNRRARNL